MRPEQIDRFTQWLFNYALIEKGVPTNRRIKMTNLHRVFCWCREGGRTPTRLSLADFASDFFCFAPRCMEMSTIAFNVNLTVLLHELLLPNELYKKIVMLDPGSRNCLCMSRWQNKEHGKVRHRLR